MLRLSGMVGEVDGSVMILSLFGVVLSPEVEVVPLGAKKGDAAWPAGLIGEVAIGWKKGSTKGFVMAVYKAVRKRRGPAGLGTAITSGKAPIEDVDQGSDACITSFTALKLARLVK